MLAPLIALVVITLITAKIDSYLVGAASLIVWIATVFLYITIFFYIVLYQMFMITFYGHTHVIRVLGKTVKLDFHQSFRLKTYRRTFVLRRYSGTFESIISFLHFNEVNIETTDGKIYKVLASPLIAKWIPGDMPPEVIAEEINRFMRAQMQIVEPVNDIKSEETFEQFAGFA